MTEPIGKLESYLVVWWCGDEVCNCYQVQVEWRGQHPHLAAPRYLFRVDKIGRYYSDPDFVEWESLKRTFYSARNAFSPDHVIAPEWWGSL